MTYSLYHFLFAYFPSFTSIRGALSGQVIMSLYMWNKEELQKTCVVGNNVERVGIMLTSKGTGAIVLRTN